jgi:hypothetical protein
MKFWKRIETERSDPSDDGTEGNSKLTDLSGILISVLIVFIVLYLMDRNNFVKFPIVYGDAGFTDLNYSPLYVFSSVNPWFNVLFIVSFDALRNEFGIIYNEIGIIPMLLMSVSMYFLLKKLKLGLPARIAGSVLYVINPTVLVWGGFEYGGPLLFLPLIALCVILYYERSRLIYLIYAGVLILLFETFIGVPDIKFLIPFLAIFLVMLIFKAVKERRMRVLSDLSIWIVFTVVVSIPLLINIGGAYELYNTAFSNSSALYNIEIGIVKDVFQASNLQNSFMGLSVYPVTYVLASGFTMSWSELVWFLIVGFSTFSVFLYRGNYRLFYTLLLILLAGMVIFQYGVYLGTFTWLYRYSFVVIYNYPLFFDEMQMFIYSVFFAWLIQLLIIKVGLIDIVKKSKHQFLATNSKKIIVVLALSALLIASFPLIHYSNGDGTLESNPSQHEVPSYLYSIVSDLAPYQGYKALVLPNNDTTLAYLDAAMPYLNVYGLPYNFQAFPQEFPNITNFGELGKAFENGNVYNVSSMLVNQGIGIIVVLNANENSTITYSSTTINGGGRNFASIINSTGIYGIVDETPRFIIYKYNGEAPSGKIVSPTTIEIANSFDNFSSDSQKIYITTGNYSHLVIPITFSGHGNFPQYIYQQRLFIYRNLSNMINKNFTNIYFAYSNGSLIPAWIQSINSTGTTIWLKLLSDVQTIYLWIFPKNYNLLSARGFLGEAPQLSAVYGEYDNGKLVFPLYDDFASFSDLNSVFYSAGNSNYTVNDGLYLGSGAKLNSYATLPNGTLFGFVDYETPNTFGHGGANVAHAIYLQNNLSNNYESIIFVTYSQCMQLLTRFNSSTDNHFGFNKLYNFTISDNGDHGVLSLGNFSTNVEMYHNASYYVMLINQASAGNNGSMYFPYIAYANLTQVRDYVFGKGFIQQPMFDNLPIGNPGDVGVPERFTAYPSNTHGNWNYTWIFDGKTIYGQMVNFSFNKQGTYNIELIANNSEMNTTVRMIYNETVKPRMELFVNSVKHGKDTYNFRSDVQNGTGAFAYFWYIDGVQDKSGSMNLTYSFSKGGNYTVLLYVLDSGGGRLLYKTYINIPLTTNDHERTNVWMIMYNALMLPLALLFFANKNLENWVKRLRRGLTNRK